MARELNSVIAVIGIDIGKNSFHIIGHHERGSIAAVHGFCRSWVIHCVADQRRRSLLSVVGPIAAKILQCRECSEVPIADKFCSAAK